ncbi:MAG: anion permease [Lachnospiraceae bacterium]|nr:anion permease [Lachnospiraceae bacterium]
MSPALLSLIIFGLFILLFIWDKLPMATSAILGCAVMVIFGLSDFSTAFGQFASSTVILLIGVMVVGSALAETGVAATFGRLMTKYSRNNERVIIAVAYVLACILSAFLTNATVLAIFMPIIIGMDTEDGKINHRNIVLPVLVATAMGGISTLVGSSQQLTANGLIEEMGYTMKVFDMTPVGAIFAVAGLIYCLFIGYPLGKKIWGGRDRFEDCEVAEAKAVVVDKRKFITMIVITVLMVASYIVALVPPVITAVTAALLCIITGCIKQKDAVTRMNWNIVGRLGACLGLAKVINSTGGIDLISEFVENILGDDISPFLLFAIMVAVIQLLSLVISNSTAILIALPIVLAMSGALNLNPVPFAMGAAYASSMGLCCPLSGSTNQMSMAAGYKFKDYFKYGVILDIICYAIIIIFVPLFFPLTL